MCVVSNRCQFKHESMLWRNERPICRFTLSLSNNGWLYFLLFISFIFALAQTASTRRVQDIWREMNFCLRAMHYYAIDGVLMSRSESIFVLIIHGKLEQMLSQVDWKTLLLDTSIFQQTLSVWWNFLKIWFHQHKTFIKEKEEENEEDEDESSCIWFSSKRKSSTN